MTQMSIMWDVLDPIWLHVILKSIKSSQILHPLGFHLSHKDLKSGQKWPNYGQFTNGRLHDSSEYHMGRIRSIRASFEPESYEIGPEMAELLPIYQC